MQKASPSWQDATEVRWRERSGRRTSSGVLADFGEVAAQDALMEKSIARSGLRVRRIIAQATKEFLGARPFGEEFRGEIAPFAVHGFSQPKADAAALHHAQKDFLFLGRVARPYERFEIGPTKALVARSSGRIFFRSKSA
jgi:hypothetical protein